MSDLVPDPRVPPPGATDTTGAPPPVVADAPPRATDPPPPADPAPPQSTPTSPDAAPVVADAVSTPPASEPPARTTEPTLFEKFDRAQADKDKPPETKETKAEDAKPPEEGTDKKPEADAPKPADGDKPPEQAADAPKPPETAPAPTREPFKFEAKLPDGITLSDDRRTELEGVLGDFLATPTAQNQERLVELHRGLVEENLNSYYNHWLEQFNVTQRQWEKEVQDDPIIGGGNHAEAMQAMAYVRDNFVSLAPRGSKEYQAARKGFDDVLYRTGMGSNPYFLHMLHNISQVLNEPRMGPTSDIKPMPAPGSPGGRPSIYKHPTSFRNGR